MNRSDIRVELSLLQTSQGIITMSQLLLQVKLTYFLKKIIEALVYFKVLILPPKWSLSIQIYKTAPKRVLFSVRIC
jgi:hypothetical protein